MFSWFKRQQIISRSLKYLKKNYSVRYVVIFFVPTAWSTIVQTFVWVIVDWRDYVVAYAEYVNTKKTLAHAHTHTVYLSHNSRIGHETYCC